MQPTRTLIGPGASDSVNACASVADRASGKSVTLRVDLNGPRMRARLTDPHSMVGNGRRVGLRDEHT
jgi:hypothetical protein